MGIINSLALGIKYGQSQEFAIKASVMTMLTVAFFGITGILCNAAGSIAVLSRWVILFEIGCLCAEFGAKFTLTYYRIPDFLRTFYLLIVYHGIACTYNMSAAIYCLLRHKKRHDLIGIVGSISFLISGFFFGVITVMILTHNIVEF